MRVHAHSHPHVLPPARPPLGCRAGFMPVTLIGWCHAGHMEGSTAVYTEQRFCLASIPKPTLFASPQAAQTSLGSGSWISSMAQTLVLLLELLFREVGFGSAWSWPLPSTVFIHSHSHFSGIWSPSPLPPSHPANSQIPLYYLRMVPSIQGYPFVIKIIFLVDMVYFIF